MCMFTTAEHVLILASSSFSFVFLKFARSVLAAGTTKLGGKRHLEEQKYTSFRLLNLRFHCINFLIVYLCQLEKEKVQTSPRY